MPIIKRKEGDERPSFTVEITCNKCGNKWDGTPLKMGLAIILGDMVEITCLKCQNGILWGS